MKYFKVITIYLLFLCFVSSCTAQNKETDLHQHILGLDEKVQFFHLTSSLDIENLQNRLPNLSKSKIS